MAQKSQSAIWKYTHAAARNHLIAQAEVMNAANRRVSNGDQVSRITALAMKRGKSVDFGGCGIFKARFLHPQKGPRNRRLLQVQYTKKDLFNELREVLALHIELMSERGKRPFSILPSAPRRYFEMYENLERRHAVRDSQPLWFGPRRAVLIGAKKRPQRRGRAETV